MGKRWTEIPILGVTGVSSFKPPNSSLGIHLYRVRSDSEWWKLNGLCFAAFWLFFTQDKRDTWYKDPSKLNKINHHPTKKASNQIFILTLLFQPKLCTTPLLRQVICSTNRQVTRPPPKKTSIANVSRFRWCVSWWPFFAVALNPSTGVGLPCYSRVFHPCWLSS